jgi:urease accessory protein
MRKTVPFALALAAVPVLAGTADAHTLAAVHGPGFHDGFAHPLSGLDHVLAMVAVGLWAAQRGGRALWAVPTAFVAMMTLGAVASGAGFALPLVEIGIAASLIVLGLLVTARVELPVALSAMIVGAFATFHGHAHGAEMPATAGALLYGLGFVAATALLHLAGIAAGLALRGSLTGRLVRLGGAGVAVVGVILAVGF